MFENTIYIFAQFFVQIIYTFINRNCMLINEMYPIITNTSLIVVEESVSIAFIIISIIKD